jgi:hypothetical protein
LNAGYHAARANGMTMLAKTSPELLSRLRYREAWGRWPDLRKPATFDEKLLWLNLYWRHPLKTECGDKFALRGWVERQQLGHLLPRLYDVYDSVDTIDFDALPERFVMKCSHGFKCNVLCNSRAELDVEAVRRQLATWMATDFSRRKGELHYAGMTPRIICEEFLDDGTGRLPTDYKLYCFGGHVHCTLVCSDRQTNGNAASDYFDRAWNRLAYDRGASARRAIPQPAAYGQMLAAAETLSAPFPFVRVDFYSVRGRAILGEMTFTPSACIDTEHTELATRKLGALITLPARLPDLGRGRPNPSP